MILFVGDPRSFRVYSVIVCALRAVRSGTSSGDDLDRNLNGLCADLIRSHQRSEASKNFKPKEARETIEEYYKKLP